MNFPASICNSLQFKSIHQYYKHNPQRKKRIPPLSLMKCLLSLLRRTASTRMAESGLTLAEMKTATDHTSEKVLQGIIDYSTADDDPPHLRQRTFPPMPSAPPLTQGQQYPNPAAFGIYGNTFNGQVVINNTFSSSSSTSNSTSATIINDK